MKTTIEIPEPLYRQAKNRAAEQGTTLKALVLEALERALNVSPPPVDSEQDVPYFARRRLLPGFNAADEAGAYTPKPGDRDVTDIISEDRDTG